MDAFSIARSGMAASLTRSTAAASNIANADTIGAAQPGPGRPGAYQPLRARITPTPGGGVSAALTPSGSAPVLRYAPDAPQADAHGMVAAPNVDSTDELVEQMSAAQDFKANAKVIRTVADLTDWTLERWG